MAIAIASGAWCGVPVPVPVPAQWDEREGSGKERSERTLSGGEERSRLSARRWRTRIGAQQPTRTQRTGVVTSERRRTTDDDKQPTKREGRSAETRRAAPGTVVQQPQHSCRQPSARTRVAARPSDGRAQLRVAVMSGVVGDGRAGQQRPKEKQPRNFRPAREPTTFQTTAQAHGMIK